MARAETVVAFTDLYAPTINGVATTVERWRDRWSEHRTSMSVVFPESEEYEPTATEYPVRSVRAPRYPKYPLGVPSIPSELVVPDVVHVHTPFTVGAAGLWYGRSVDVPVVASYHTLLDDRANQHVPSALAGRAKRACRAYERSFFERVDHVTAPTAYARDHLSDHVGATVDVTVVSNGIDIGVFEPVDPGQFRERYEIPADRPVVGYTGRHGPEKNLDAAIDAVDGMGVTLVLGGDGPARGALESRASEVDAAIRFLGFLDAKELPAFYSALDAFVFPSPVETQGLVALEATACGTPIVAVDAGALTDTVIHGETGYRYPPGDIAGFRSAIRSVLDERERLSDLCRRRRPMLSVSHSIEQLASVYDDLL